MRLFHLLVVLVSLVAVVASDTNCSKEFAESEGSHKVLCDACSYEIVGKASFGIKLEVKEAYYQSSQTIYVWEVVHSNESHRKILRSVFQRAKVLYSSINSTLLLETNSEAPNCNDYYLHSFSFTRFSPQKQWCAPLLQYIGSKVTTIQKHGSRNTDSCSYRIIPNNHTKTEEEYLYVVVVGEVDGETVQFRFSNGTITESKSLMLSNWAELDIISTIPSAHNSQTNEIRAISTTRVCYGFGETNTLQTNGSVLSLFSHGFPDFSCPQVFSKTTIHVVKGNISSELLPRVLVSMNFIYRGGVIFKLTAQDLELSMDDVTTPGFPNSFLLNPNDISIYYETPRYLAFDTAGHFAMNLSQVFIKNECDCSTLMEKKYYQDWDVKILIPDTCDFMFCSWHIYPAGQELKKTANITISNANADDELRIWNEKFNIIYDGIQMTSKRTMYLKGTSRGAHFAFWRRSKGSNSTISIKWQDVANTGCLGQTNMNISEVPISFLSSNYPSPYKNMDYCYYTLQAAENHRIEIDLTDIEVENMHDHLSFYDGNSSHSSPLIGHFTGKQKNIQLSSTGSQMYIQFESDAHSAHRGYHFTAVAVENNSSASAKQSTWTASGANTTTQTTSEVTSTESLSSPSHQEHEHSDAGFILTLVLILTIIAVVAVACLVFFKYWKNIPRNPRSFANAMVRFRSEDNGSTISIST